MDGGCGKELSYENKIKYWFSLKSVGKGTKLPEIRYKDQRISLRKNEREKISGFAVGIFTKRNQKVLKGPSTFHK